MPEIQDPFKPTCAVEALSPICGDDAIAQEIFKRATVVDEAVVVFCGTCMTERTFSVDSEVVPVCFVRRDRPFAD